MTCNAFGRCNHDYLRIESREANGNSSRRVSLLENKIRSNNFKPEKSKCSNAFGSCLILTWPSLNEPVLFRLSYNRPWNYGTHERTVKHMSFFPENRWTKNEPMFDPIWILYLLSSSHQTHGACTYKIKLKLDIGAAYVFITCLIYESIHNIAIKIITL